MRTGHFSSEKQTVEIRIGRGGESIPQLYRAYLRVAPRETIRIISIPRTEGLCNAIGCTPVLQRRLRPRHRVTEFWKRVCAVFPLPPSLVAASVLAK